MRIISACLHFRFFVKIVYFKNFNVIQIFFLLTLECASLLWSMIYTVNIEVFAVYIFSLNLRFLNIFENIYTVKITIIIAKRVIYTKNANFNTHEIAHFHKSAKIDTRENIYIYSIQK